MPDQLLLDEPDDDEAQQQRRAAGEGKCHDPLSAVGFGHDGHAGDLVSEREPEWREQGANAAVGGTA